MARSGLPPQSSIIAETQFAPVRPAAAAAAPGGAASYRILRTNEVDPYKLPMLAEAVAGFAPAAAPVSDNFTGTDRKAAKLVIAKGQPESFNDLPDLIKTLPSKSKMAKHKPPVTKDATSGRVQEEMRNVRLRGFLYAASREKDNDFHLIVGRDPAKPPMYMTAEVSGLPPSNSPSFAKLKAARNAYKAFFADQHLPGTGYDFYDPPIPILIEGSLFFDVTHANGQGPGPKTLHADIPTIWEIHPVSNIVFEP